VRIFSDVDGTFLGEGGAVSLDEAELARAREHHEIVFVSSRTGAELRTLQERLGLTGWAIGEDGCVLLHPDGSVEPLGLATGEIVRRLATAGAGEPLETLQRNSPRQPDRIASVLLPREAGESARWAHFRHLATSADLRCSIGGKWTTLTAGPDKGEAVALLCQRLGWLPDAGIGNDANDVSLLRVVHRGFVVRNPEGHHPALAGIPGIRLLQRSGLAGWKEMLDTL